GWCEATNGTFPARCPPFRSRIAHSVTAKALFSFLNNMFAHKLRASRGLGSCSAQKRTALGPLHVSEGEEGHEVEDQTHRKVNGRAREIRGCAFARAGRGIIRGPRGRVVARASSSAP